MWETWTAENLLLLKNFWPFLQIAQETDSRQCNGPRGVKISQLTSVAGHTINVIGSNVTWSALLSSKNLWRYFIVLRSEGLEKYLETFEDGTSWGELLAQNFQAASLIYHKLGLWTWNGNFLLWPFDLHPRIFFLYHFFNCLQGPRGYLNFRPGLNWATLSFNALEVGLGPFQLHLSH